MIDMDSLRLPPHSDDAEICFLSAAIERNSLVDDAEGIIQPESFYRHENQVIFRRMSAMSLARMPIDPVTLINALDGAGELQEVGADYVVEMATNGRGGHNAIHYAHIIRAKAIDRGLIRNGFDIGEIAYSDGTPEEKIDRAQALVMGTGIEQAGDAVHINDGLKDLIAHIEKLHENKGEVQGLKTGFSGLDAITAGLQDSDMVVLAGRPAMGKTTLAMNIAEYAGTVQKKNVLVFSLEMPIKQLMMRMACSIGRIPFEKLKRGDMEDHWHSLTAAVSKIKDSPIYIDDRSSISSEQLLSRARKIQKKMGGRIDLIVIDYIQLMTDKGESVERTTKISRNVKLCAKELNCPVIAISQLSRKCEERPNKRPVASDLRDSGAIEQDADIIVMMYRDEVYNTENSPMKGVAEAIIRKHRNGEIGSVYLSSNLGVCRFDNNINYVPPALEPVRGRRSGLDG